jgi:hypothetical protein
VQFGFSFEMLSPYSIQLTRVLTFVSRDLVNTKSSSLAKPLVLTKNKTHGNDDLANNQATASCLAVGSGIVDSARFAQALLWFPIDRSASIAIQRYSDTAFEFERAA